MTPVDQDVFGEGKGNCWAACIASLLDLPLSEVPNFCGEPERNDNWFKDTDEWLKQRGYRIIGFEGATGISMGEGAYALVTGPSPRGNFSHVVVWESGRELVEAIRAACLQGLVPVGPLIQDGNKVLQVMRPR
jgi:hypothetical protein